MAPHESPHPSVTSHYNRPGLADLILAALARAGKDIHALRPEDLAPVDEFHIRGREATLELAREAGLGPGARVLDAGSGLGGPSRCLAQTFGCSVTGIDLTAAYCETATILAERVGLDGAVRYQQGDALDLPFEDRTFDAVWSQHTAMNIPDKPRLYRELGRVLRSGGTLAIYDVVAAGGGPIHLPVPWAREPEASHLATAPALREMLVAAGFQVRAWKDSTPQALQWCETLAKRMAAQGPPPLGLHLLMGETFPAMAHNLGRNLMEGRIGTVQAIATRG